MRKNDLSWFVDLRHWTGLRCLVMVRAAREVTCNPYTTEIRLYITSLSDSQKAFDVARKHWHVENNLYWFLDLLFRERMTGKQR